MEGLPRRTAVIIEDDPTIRQLVGIILEHLGLEFVGTSNGVDGVQAVRAHEPVVVTLDVNMPGMDGFETAKQIRAISPTYIIMLTARDDEIDTLQGLGAGADDYVLKPFRPRELRARIEAMLRRPRSVTQPAHTPQDPAALLPVASPSVDHDAAEQTPPAAPANGTLPGAAEPYRLAHNGLHLDPDSRLVELDGAPVELTRSEFNLLQALLESGRRVRNKSDLAVLLRGEDSAATHYVSDADRRGVEVHIANLRKKLGDNATRPRLIETVRGVGYRLTALQA